jgi:hypothetical protein
MSLKRKVSHSKDLGLLAPALAGLRVYALLLEFWALQLKRPPSRRVSTTPSNRVEAGQCIVLTSGNAETRRRRGTCQDSLVT